MSSQIQPPDSQTIALEGLTKLLADKLPDTSSPTLGYKVNLKNVGIHLLNTLFISIFIGICIVSIQFIRKYRSSYDGRPITLKGIISGRFMMVVIPITASVFFLMQLLTPVTFQQLLTGVGYAAGLSFFIAMDGHTLGEVAEDDVSLMRRKQKPSPYKNDNDDELIALKD